MAESCELAVFREKLSKYNKYTTLVCIWQCGIQALAFFSAEDDGFMGCHDSGNTWVYTSVLGSLFTMFHMMSILM